MYRQAAAILLVRNFKELLKKLGLPEHLSPNAMLPVLSALYDRESLLEEMKKL